MFTRSPFAEDIFISYARNDSSTYATGLADELTKRGFSCFIDRLKAEPSPVVTKSLKRRLRNCGLMVVIVTRWSGTRESIQDELVEFNKTKRPIIPVDIDESIYDAIWYDQVEGIPREPEQNPTALSDGNPSPSVVSRIEKAFTYRKSKDRLRNWTIGTAITLAILIGISVFTAAKARNEIVRAARANEAANNANKQAEASKKEASDARGQAAQAQGEFENAQKNLTETQNNLAKAKRDFTRAQTDLVNAQAKVAEAQTRLAKANNDLASAREETKKEIARAEAATKEAKRGTIRFYHERGRQTLLNGNPEGALAYLNQAYQMVHDGTGLADYPRQNSLNFLLSWSSLFLSGEVASLNGHQNRVTSGAFSPDGTKVITLSADGSAKVWNSSDGKLLATLSGRYSRPVMLDAYFSPDSKRIFTRLGYIETPDDPELPLHGRVVGLLWNGETYERINPLDGDYVLEDDGDIPVRLTRFSPPPCFSADGSRFDLTLYDDSSYTTKVFNSKDGEEIENGVRACSGSGGTRQGTWDSFRRSVVRVKDTSNDKEVEFDTRETHIADVIFSPTVSKFVTTFGNGLFDADVPATTASTVAKLWDATSGHLLATLDAHKDLITSAVFSPDERMLLTASKDGTAKIWDVRTGSLLASLEGHRDAVLSGAFSSDGKQVLTFGEDNRAIIWDWQNTRRSGRTVAQIGGRSAVFSSNGDRVIADDGKHVSSSPIGPGSAPSAIALPDGTDIVAISPNGERVIAREQGALKLFAVKTGARVGDLLVKEAATVAFSHNSKYVVIASHRDDDIVVTMKVQVWDAESGQLKEPELKDRQGFIDALGDVHTGVTVAVNSSGTRVFAYAEDRGDLWTSRWDDWNPYYAHTLAKTHKGVVTLAAFTPDDEFLLTASEDKTIKIWKEDAKKGELTPVRTLTGHSGQITAIKFSADKKFVASASVDGSAKVWEIATGALVASCDGHRGRVNAVDFSGDGERLVTAGEDGTLRVWDAKTGDLLATIEAHAGGATTVAYSSKGDWVVTTGADRAVGIWDLSSTVLDPKQLSNRVARVVSLQISNDQLVPKASN